MSKETWGSDFLVVWDLATTTDGFKEDKLSVASPETMGVQFLRRAVDASMQLHSYQYSHREEYFRRQYPQLATFRQWIYPLLEGRRRGDRMGDVRPGGRAGGCRLGGGLRCGGLDNGRRRGCVGGTPPNNLGNDLSDEEVEWPHCDDIQAPGVPYCEQVYDHGRCS